MDHTDVPARRRRSSRALVTAAGPQLRAGLQDLALPTFARYAAQWDWELVVEDLAIDGADAQTVARQARWAKLRLIRQALAAHDLVLWLDPDVLVLRDDEDVAQHLHPETFQALALEHVPAEHRVNPNTGVWLVRSCPQAFAFLDAVAAAGQQPGPWADQGAVLAALGWDRGDERYHWARPGPGNAHLAGTSWLPPSWNQAVQDLRVPDGCADRPRVVDPHVLHFSGLPPAERYRAMAQVVGVPVLRSASLASG